MSNFFIDRPIFAWVLAILLCLCGTLSIISLPIEQYPDLAPPNVRITANYPGASAQTLENTVTQVIEQNMTGIDNLMYMSSNSSNTGQAQITLTFTAGTNPDEARQQVQNQLQSALRKLPQAVQSQGVTVNKTGDSNILMVAFVSTDGSMDKQDISDYVASNIQDPLSRIDGVGQVDAYGSQYAMRIWLDPNKLIAYSLTTEDVVSAIQSQNTQVAVGQVGGLPSVEKQALNATVNAQSMLQTPEQFRAITLKNNPDGSVVTLGDVASVALGAEKYDYLSRYNGQPASGLGVKLASGANEMNTDKLVRARIEELSHYFPHGLEAKIAYETSPFVKASITDVVKTLLEAIVLVFGVMYLFMQNFRATLIPTIAVPVVLFGTFSVLYACGFSINTLTMFAMVLAIGLLVDDAIVVVENVERIMHDEGLPAREATEKSMKEISGALVAIALVLSAVFLPMAFFAGSTGVIYRQFSITIIAAMTFSVVVALTLTPALCGMLLRPTSPHRKGFFGGFNRFYAATERQYRHKVVSTLRRPLIMVSLYAAMGVVLFVMFTRLPGSFLPTEDQGSIMLQATLPAGATASRTEAVNQQIVDWFLTEEKQNIDVVFTINGFNFSGAAQNAGMAFIKLKNWDQRPGSENSAEAIAGRATYALASIRDAQIFALTPPSVPGLGQNNGFTYELLASGGTTREQLGNLRDQLLQSAAQSPELLGVRANILPQTPQLQVDIDTSKAVALGLQLDDVTDTLTSAWGGAYINDFIDRGRVKRVYVQGDGQYRSSPSDLDKWYIRNSEGTMTPFSAFASTRWTMGPESLNRYNGSASYEIQGQNAEGFSSGDAMNTIERLANELPAGTTGAWSGLSLQEKQAGGQSTTLYAISILVVFLCLAALYESWSVPFSVLLAVPLGVLGTVLAVALRGLSNDIYFQVALLTTVGLTSKNAILIIEFAEDAVRRGSSLSAAALQAARTRLRPIMMTSLAFIAGVIPLAVATGAGANSRIAIGTGIIGGTLAGTVLALFFVPLFFVLVKHYLTRHRKGQ